MSVMQEAMLKDVVAELRACSTFEEVQEIDAMVNEERSELLCEAYYAVIDEQKARFEALEAQPINMDVQMSAEVVQMPDEEVTIKRSELEELMRLVRERVSVKKSVAKVRYQVLRRNYGASELPPQAEAIVAGLLAVKKEVWTDVEIEKLVNMLHDEGILVTGQSPMRIFKYYFSHGTRGFKASGFMRKL